jgi:hypothetical protein
MYPALVPPLDAVFVHNSRPLVQIHNFIYAVGQSAVTATVIKEGGGDKKFDVRKPLMEGGLYKRD